MRRRELAAMGYLGPIVQGPPVPSGLTLFWKADYDAAGITTSGTNGAWAHEQPPRAPGLSGTTQATRISIVPAPGTGSRKPAGNVMRIELRPYSSTNPGSVSPADGDVNPSGTANRVELYDRYPLSGASSTPPENWPDPVGSVRWYGFSLYIPADFAQSTNNWFTCTQWKGFYGGSPPQALEIDNDRFELGGTHGRRDLGAITPGAWHEFQFGFKWSTASDGWVDVWHNDVNVLPQESRATMDTSSGHADPIYFKQGMYRTSAWAFTHTLYYGPAKVGLTRNDVLPG